jgi:hypothetical protein
MHLDPGINKKMMNNLPGVTWLLQLTGLPNSYLTEKLRESSLHGCREQNVFKRAEQENSLGFRQAGPSFLRGRQGLSMTQLQLLLPPLCPQRSTLLATSPHLESQGIKSKHLKETVLTQANLRPSVFKSLRNYAK